MSLKLEAIHQEIKKMRKVFDDFLTDELKEKLIQALETITQQGNNPQIENLLHSLNHLLSQKHQTQFFDLVSNVDNLLKQIDPAVVENSLRAITAILDQARENNIIGKISTLLDSAISSGPTIQKLVDVMEYLVIPAQIALYGGAGLMLAKAISLAINSYLGSKSDQLLEKILAANNQILFINVAQLRQLATQTIQNHYIAGREMSIEDQKLIDPALIEARNILKNLRPMSDKTNKIIGQMQGNIEKALDLMYAKQLNNPTLEDFLNSVESDSNQSILIEHLHKYWFEGISIGDIQFTRTRMNYDTARRLYGEEIHQQNTIDIVKNKLIEYLMTYGGYDIYRFCANYNGDSSTLFRNVIINLLHKTTSEELAILESVVGPCVRVFNDALEHTQLIVNNVWNTVNQPRAKGKPIVALPDDVVKVIEKRALLEFFSEHVKWFKMFRAAPREIYNGVVNVPKSYWELGKFAYNAACLGISTAWNGVMNINETTNTVCHYGLDILLSPFDLRNAEQRQHNQFLKHMSAGTELAKNVVVGIGNAAWYHPISTVTSLGVNAGVGYSAQQLWAAYGSSTVVPETIILNNRIEQATQTTVQSLETMNRVNALTESTGRMMHHAYKAAKHSLSTSFFHQAGVITERSGNLGRHAHVDTDRHIQSEQPNWCCF